LVLLLLGGLRSAAYSDIAKGKDSDAEVLARATLIPRVLWKVQPGSTVDLGRCP
jgi:hypothetical protein